MDSEPSKRAMKTVTNCRQMNNCPNNFYFKHCIVFLKSYKVVLNLNGSPLYQKSHTHYKNRDYLEHEGGGRPLIRQAISWATK